MAARGSPCGPLGLLAELAEDSDEDVREAACGARPACRQEGCEEVAARALELLAELVEDSGENVGEAA